MQGCKFALSQQNDFTLQSVLCFIVLSFKHEQENLSAHTEQKKRNNSSFVSSALQAAC